MRREIRAIARAISTVASHAPVSHNPTIQYWTAMLDMIGVGIKVEMDILDKEDSENDRR